MKKNTHLEGQGCKIFLSVILLYGLILAIPLISAAGFDNSVTYTNSDMTAKIDNWFGILKIFGINDNIGEVTLKSHSSINEVRSVLFGKDRLVMWYDFNFTESYPEGLGKVTFTDMRSNKEIDKDYYFVEAIYETTIVPIIDKGKCVEAINKLGAKYLSCENKEIGNNTIKRIVGWNKIEDSNIPKGATTIGLVTNVNREEYVDAVWNIAGKNINKHASWADNWGKCKAVNVTGSTTDLTGFVFYANITYDSDMKADFSDIRFTNSTCWDDLATELSYEVEGAINSNSVGVWIKGDLKTNTNQFAMYYKNPSATSVSNGATTWNGFNSVFHMNGSHMDSKGLANGSAVGTPAYTGGVFSSAISVTAGANGGFSYVYNRDGNLQEGRSMWVYPTNSIVDNQGLMSTEEDTSYGWRNDEYMAAQVFKSYYGDGSAQKIMTSPTKAKNNWYNFGMFCDVAIPDTCYMYINGENVDNETYADMGNTKPTTYIGANSATADVFSGYIDEYKETKDVQNTPSWFFREYKNADSSYVVFGEETDPTATATPIIINTTLTSANGVNTSSTNNYFSASYIAVNSNLTNGTLYIWRNDNTLIGRNITEINGLTNSTNLTYSLSQGVYYWNYLGCSVNFSDSRCSFYTTNHTITIDYLAPTINIVYPLNNSEIITTSALTNITFNSTIYDTSGINTCWVYNGSANNTLATPGLNTTIYLVEGYNPFIIYCNDSLGNLGENRTTFLLNYVRNVVSYTTPIFENTTNNIYFALTATSINSAMVNMSYNNTFYNMSNDISSLNSTYRLFYKAVLSPATTSDRNININFTYSVNGNNLSTINYSQSVLTLATALISAIDCDTKVYNFSLYDEENLTIINGTFDYNFRYGGLNNTYKRIYGKISNINFFLCMNTSLNVSLGEGEIAYSSPGYVDRRYYIFSNTTIVNGTLIKINLYDLIVGSQTSFKLDVENSMSLIPYVSKYTSLIRWYPDLNEYKIVDMGLTDEKGSTIIHVVSEDVDYRIGVYELDGTLIKLANPIRMACVLSPCTYTLRIVPEETDYTSFLGIDYNFDFNSANNIWTFMWNDQSQKTNTINLTIYKDAGISSYAICSNVVTGYTGAVTCNTSGYSGSLRGVVQRAASPPVTIASKLQDVLATAAAFRSDYGLFVTFIIALPIILIFVVVSPIIAIIGGVIALIPALYLQSVNLAIVAAFAVLGGLIIHIIKRVQ